MKFPGRLFVFGCSMTRYWYPTWADFLGKNWEYYENWADPGAGNLFIFNSVIECDQRNRFTNGDTVMILWSGVVRSDAYNHVWRHIAGYDEINKVNKFVNCTDGYDINTYALITATHQYLDSKGVKFRSMHWPDYDLDSPIANVYKSGLSKLEKFDLPFNRTEYSANFDQLKTSTYNILYKQLAGDGWPPVKDIRNGNYSATPAIQKEIDNFLALVESQVQFGTKLNKFDRHPLPSQHLYAVRQKFPEISMAAEVTKDANTMDSIVLQGKSVDFDPHLPKIRF